MTRNKMTTTSGSGQGPPVTTAALQPLLTPVLSADDAVKELRSELTAQMLAHRDEMLALQRQMMAQLQALAERTPPAAAATEQPPPRFTPPSHHTPPSTQGTTPINWNLQRMAQSCSEVLSSTKGVSDQLAPSPKLAVEPPATMNDFSSPSLLAESEGCFLVFDPFEGTNTSSHHSYIIGDENSLGSGVEKLANMKDGETDDRLAVFCESLCYAHLVFDENPERDKVTFEEASETVAEADDSVVVPEAAVDDKVAMASQMSNKQVIWKDYVTSFPKELDMELRNSTITLKLPQEGGGLVVKNLYLSCDPYMRGRMTKRESASYVDTFHPGSPITGFGLAKVLESRGPRFEQGDLVLMNLRNDSNYNLSPYFQHHHFSPVISTTSRASSMQHGFSPSSSSYASSNGFYPPESSSPYYSPTTPLKHYMNNETGEGKGLWGLDSKASPLSHESHNTNEILCDDLDLAESFYMMSVGNVFVKNLSDGTDNVALQEMFKQFGNVMSCKVAMFEDGKSKGYVFVQFETEELAVAAIDKLNGFTDAAGKQLYVTKFVRKSERVLPNPDVKYTNLHVKNMDPDVREELLEERFSAFGKIVKLAIAMDDNGISKGFGFVNFESPDDAKRALESLNGSQLGSKVLYVARAQKKPEHASKITGMLLEMDNSELLLLLELPESLAEKVTEAVQVLKISKKVSSKDSLHSSYLSAEVTVN